MEALALVALVLAIIIMAFAIVKNTVVVLWHVGRFLLTVWSKWDRENAKEIDSL